MRSSALIVALWAVVISGAVLRAPQLPLPLGSDGMSSPTVFSLLAMPILFFAAMSVWGRPQSPFYHPRLAAFINSRYGTNTLESFLVRLKPLLMFGAAGVLQGVIGLWHGRGTSEPVVMHGFLLSGGVGFVVAHAVLYRRKAVGVFPWTTEQLMASARQPERKPLGEALRTYWWTLLGVAVFPMLFFGGGEFLDVPFEYLLLPFFAACFLAGWPYLSGRAPYSFWIVAMGVWLGGGIVAIVLLHLLQTANVLPFR